jgi:5-methylcytosine-specific restriction endonuclease McrBC regulatory subunit McrC
MIGTPTLQLQVNPKIPQAHLLHLLRLAEVLPRVAEHPGGLSTESNFAALVCHWFVLALDRLLEEGLARDYKPVVEEIGTVRGRISPLPTARFFYRGRATVVAEFEEFDFDTPLNRVLLHAARIIAAASSLPTELRRSAIRATKQLEGVGRFRPADLSAEPDRRTSNYLDAITLGRQVIRATGRALEAGPIKSWTFLLRTPEPVEAGIRSLLRRALTCTVERRSIRLTGSTMTVNPDLVFGDDAAVADIKYKIGQREWNRADLYEVVAFAAALSTPNSAILTFRDPATPQLADVQLRDFRVAELTWPAAKHVPALSAADALVAQVVEWLTNADMTAATFAAA